MEYTLQFAIYTNDGGEGVGIRSSKFTRKKVNFQEKVAFMSTFFADLCITVCSSSLPDLAIWHTNLAYNIKFVIRLCRQ